MEVCPDYEDIFKLLNTYKIRYLVVGAHAVIFYTRPRYTKDMDIWVEPEPNNSLKIYKALKEFGSPLENISPKDFTNKKMIYQIGIAPVRIDILLDIAGIPFELAWKNKVSTQYGKTPIHILCLSDLIRAKEHAHRDRDQLDLQNLLKKNKRK